MSETKAKLILCEGKTDAILLSYYLHKVCGWNHQKKPLKGLNLKVESTQTFNRYSNDNENLIICAVGGVDNFCNFFNDYIYQLLIASSLFSKIAFVVDKDNRSEDDIIGEFSKISSSLENTSSLFANIQNNTWNTSSYKDSFKTEKQIETMLLIIPNDKEGALETVLLDCLSENDGIKKNIVDSSKEFVDEIALQASDYLNSERLKLKAKLGVTFAIMSPQKVFDFIDEQIKGIPWEQSDILKQLFSKLIEV